MALDDSVAGLLNRCGQSVLVGDLRIVVDARLAVLERHGFRLHSRLGAEERLDCPSATVTMHAVDLERHGFKHFFPFAERSSPDIKRSPALPDNPVVRAEL
jgi:hypothetical protein